MKENIAKISILANMVLAIGKISVGIFSNSAAILASGVDSLVDIFSSAISYVGIKIAGKPADKKHPYGHYKFEVLSGVIITLIIFTTGVGIIYDAFQNIFRPEVVALNYLSFCVMIFSVLVNEIMSRLKIYYGKKESSVSLFSDGTHSKIDVYTSLAVLFGLFLTKYWIYADAFLALLIGIYIIKEAFSLGKEAIGSLLDVSAGPEVEGEIKKIIKDHGVEASVIKTQKKGSAITANLEIKLPSSLKVEEATKISENLRKELMEKINNLSYIAIQIKSHDVETGFYKPVFGRGFGWQRHGKFEKRPEGYPEKAEGMGPGGLCACPKCGYKTEHKVGTPCSTLQCPKCNINLERK